MKQSALKNKKVTGIIWVGPIFQASGYGSVTRNFLKGFKEIGFPVKAVNIRPAKLRNSDEKLLDPETLREIDELTKADPGPYPVVVINSLPEAYSSIVCKNIVAKVGCTIFETDRIPESWVDICNKLDEVWVPSRFNLQTFTDSGVRSNKVKVFPYGVNTSFFKPIEDKVVIENKKRFSFLYVSFFNYRKGFDLLLEAYLKEFTSNDDVSLIIKTGFAGHNMDPKKDDAYFRNLILNLIKGRVDLSNKELPHFEIITEPFDEQKLRALYNTCDLYISTDRANGWGMPCMEAMSMGKPAATIDWSGSMEFMKDGNSLLIKPTGKLIPVDDHLSSNPIYKGHKWAEVTVDEVRRVMRYSYENQAELLEIGQKGMEYVRDNYSIARSTERIKDYLLSVQIKNDLNGKPKVNISFAKRVMAKLRRLISRK